MNANTIKDFISGLPKAELHLHICGTLEPEMLLEFANRNKQPLHYKNENEVRQAYQFNDLAEFLDIYHEGTLTIHTAQDFYDLTLAYLQKVHTQNVLHAEISVDPQTFLKRGMTIDQIFDGILRAMEDAKAQLGISVELVMDFIRNFDEEDALETLRLAKPYLDRIIAVGLGSTEVGHPPGKFKRAFRQVGALGLFRTAHAGEEGPADYVRESMDYLEVDRIDHGIRAMEDPDLVHRIAEEQIPLTLCPLSNKALQVVADLKDYPIREMLKQRLLITINSDDPSYFHGYINENYLALAEALDLSEGILAGLAKNSFKASFISEERKAAFIEKVDDYYHKWMEGRSS
ncbi:MAG: adenosine deaminase [Bacteroidetes bacterium]|nr:adenosine deaminase [Bacteroidota bacterium]